MRQVTVLWQDVISKVVGTLDVPDDATPEQIQALVQDFGEEHAGGGLCHHCARDVGELGGGDEFIATDEDGNEIVTSLVSDLHSENQKLRAMVSELRAQLDAK